MNKKIKTTVNNNQTKHLQSEKQKLCAFLSDCRLDMHNPSQQGVEAVVYGKTLDNAGVDGEIYVTFLKNDKTAFTINLATLVAIARL